MYALIASALVPVLGIAYFELCRLRRSLDRSRLESRTDSLTGCWNKRRWFERLDELRGKRFSFVLLDLANLKAANALLGHAGADDVLAEVAAEIRGETDRVYRTGGDEFAVLLPGCGLADAKAVRDRIEAKIGIRFLAPACPVFLAGGAGSHDPGQALDDLLRAADREQETRKADRKLQLGAPLTREETLALLPA
tara:strand:+ start:41532 stop:42116 length:585 start_codon:yes stop_codon:yes gene_type:complete